MPSSGAPSGLSRLPPLNALKAFEAAARHLNFSLAARELSVTPGAISQQIRLLEDHAGGPLFRREGRSVVLTDLGNRLQPFLREAFEHLKGAAEVIYGLTKARTLSVSVPPTFAAKWLVPRLARFSSLRPDIEVWVSADMKLADVSGGRVDVAVRFGRGDYPGVRTRHLMDAGVIPVCSPDLLPEGKPYLKPAALARRPLIHVTSTTEEPMPDWSAWLASRGLGVAAAEPGLRFDQTALAIDAALHGRGIALAPRVFVDPDLAVGRLVAPVADGLLPSDLSYWTLVRKASPREETIAFVNWLMSEVGRTQGAAEQL